jgi:predicted ATPase
MGMTRHCDCELEHAPRLVVLTGGPGAGKTAVLDVVQRNFCGHVVVLPEAAGILWNGGFPRRESMPARLAAQRAIYRVQTELQRLAIEDGNTAAVLCDRGTLDGLAYWPGEPAAFFSDLGTTREAELARYAAVIHLRPPKNGQGYNHKNRQRIESARQAAAIDARIVEAWFGHPRLFTVDSDDDFLVKLQRTLELVRNEIPPCCRYHPARAVVAA